MLKVIELFAGIGSYAQALKNIGIEHKVVAISEIDKFALKSYEALHGKTINLGDIRNIKELPQVDMLCFSAPCVDISVAGKLAGLGEGTRSGLIWEVLRLLENANKNNVLPKFLIMENVKNLVSKRFKSEFEKILAFLTSIGYKNYWQVLNAKDYGVPQNRERVFLVAIRNQQEYKFPPKQELKICLRDILDKEVNEKYYLKKSTVESIMRSTFRSRKALLKNPEEISNCLRARDYHEPQCIKIATLTGGKWNKVYNMNKAVYAIHGVAPTIHTCIGGTTKIKIADEIRVNLNQDETDEIKVVAMRGRNLDNTSDRKSGIKLNQVLEENKKGISNTITSVQKNNLITCSNESEVKYVRKITEVESWRHMGWKDEQIKKVKEAGISKTQMYKQAGNGIVIDVLEAIFRNLFVNTSQ